MCSWYHLAEKTFRIEGQEKIWKAMKKGTYPAHQIEWTPYTPKVRWHIHIHICVYIYVQDYVFKC